MIIAGSEWAGISFISRPILCWISAVLMTLVLKEDSSSETRELFNFSLMYTLSFQWLESVLRHRTKYLKTPDITSTTLL